MTDYLEAAYNVVVNCLEIEAGDRLLIITDEETKTLAAYIKNEALKTTPNVFVVKIEDYIVRPAKNLPAQMIEDIEKFSPNVSIYCAQGQKGELPVFRRPLIDDILVKKHKCFHAHMIGITENIINQGLRADHNKLYDFTMKVYNILTNSTSISVKSSQGTDLQVNLSKDFLWVPSHGKIKRSEKWQNLPGTEVFTCPQNISGVVHASVLGDYFSQRGLLKEPVIFEIENSYIKNISCQDKNLLNELKDYLLNGENNNRVGEFAFGTNIFLTQIIGNMLQDEKYPGVHLAFGYPYPQETKAKWTAQNHLDVIPLNVDVYIDGEKIIQDNKYLI